MWAKIKFILQELSHKWKSEKSISHAPENEHDELKK